MLHGPSKDVTALGAAAVKFCYLPQGYSDLGFGHWGTVFTIAAGYALAGKICVANGAWDLATIWSASASTAVSPGDSIP